MMEAEPVNSSDSGAAQGVLSIEAALKAFAVEFDGRFDEYLTPAEDVPPELAEVMRYSALAPGKRIRPYLVVRSCELAGGRRESAWPVAAAVECIHAFSLVHDDLPAMDNDDLRRGLPTAHKKFSEALAILAGDALAVLAFELLGRHLKDYSRAVQIVGELARGAGWGGMIGGQTADILGQSHHADLGLTRYIHTGKTARLFAVACRMGALVGGSGPAHLAALGRFGERLGRVFQITDDLLDESSSAQVLGKGTKKDSAAGKQTYPRCVGKDKSRRLAIAGMRAAVASLAPFGPAADDLRRLAEYVAYRNY